MDIDITYSTENFKNLLYSIEEILDISINAKSIEKAVENTRHISEFLIYGWNKQNTYFEMFAERNILEVFENILDIGNEEI